MVVLSISGVHSELHRFLKLRGHSLVEAGSAALGLGGEDARAFLGMLRARDVPIVGMEIWRKIGHRYRLDGREVWYPIHKEPQLVYLDALDYLSSIKPRQDDVFTIQLG